MLSAVTPPAEGKFKCPAAGTAATDVGHTEDRERITLSVLAWHSDRDHKVLQMADT